MTSDYSRAKVILLSYRSRCKVEGPDQGGVCLKIVIHSGRKVIFIRVIDCFLRADTSRNSVGHETTVPGPVSILL